MSKVIDILKTSQKPFASFELVPPLKGSDVSRLYDSIDPLMQFQPPFINVTCHRDEVEYVPNSDGTYTKMTLAKRPSTIAIVAAIMRRYPQLEIVPHVICGGASRSKVESELLDLHFLGIQNIVALRGDAIPGQRFFIPEADGFSHSSELVSCFAWSMSRLYSSGFFFSNSTACLRACSAAAFCCISISRCLTAFRILVCWSS